MGKKIILSESQFFSILNEELGISNEIIKKTDEVYSIICDAVKNNKQTAVSFEYYTFNQFSITFEWFNAKVITSVDCYNYINKEMYKFSNVRTDGWSSYADKKYLFMGLVVPCISGTILKEEVKDTIQHELEHLYQQIIMGKPFSNNKIYNMIKTNRNNKENDVIRNAAQLAYGCIKSEQDGYINGLYSYLMSIPSLFSFSILKKSPVWKLYEEMNNIYEKYKDTPEFLLELKKYKLTHKKIEKSLGNFVRKIGRVVAKVKNDKYEKQGWRD